MTGVYLSIGKGLNQSIRLSQLTNELENYLPLNIGVCCSTKIGVSRQPMLCQND